MRAFYPVGHYIGIDVDGVVAEIHKPWVQWLNERFGLAITEFTHWNHMLDLVGKAGLDFLTPTIYEADIVKPVPGALAAVEEIRKLGHTVLFISHCIDGTIEVKRDWLFRHGFLRDDSERHRFISMADKTNAPVYMLVDDAIHNVRAFRGVSVLLTASHNVNEQWRGIRINHLVEVLPFIHQ